MATIETVTAAVHARVWTAKKLGMKVAVYLLEASDAAVQARIDKDLFTAKKFNWIYVEEMPLRCELARDADARWQLLRHEMLKEATRRYAVEGPAAWAVRTAAIKDMRLAFSGDRALLKRLSDIIQGRSLAAKIQSMYRLHNLCTLHSELLAAVNFSAERIEELHELGGKMALLIAECSLEGPAKSAEKQFRDKALAHVDEALKKIRHTGKAVHAYNSLRYNAYISTAGRKKNRSRKSLEERLQQLIARRAALQAELDALN